ncbi:MAG TPA: (2Fe-2S)-binding protein [Pseudonocardia sp.]|jgi:carbon-monoxide dehydrogenase small subunit|nr:(2Fe-2S)-binding protein [Pseudonocardia sp.]
MEVRIVVNGTPVELSVEPRLSLADLLRDRLGLTGTHLGCEHGVCGACSVLLDGRSVRACLTLAVQAHGHRVTTVEGLAEHRTTRSLVTALSAAHGLQCGFCTAGFLVSATELLEESDGTELTDRDVRAALSGNLCRCTGYQGIIEAVRQAATDSAVRVQAVDGATPPS